MNILLAYNDTDASNRALERAAQLARLYEAKLDRDERPARARRLGTAPTWPRARAPAAPTSACRSSAIEAELVEAVGDIAGGDRGGRRPHEVGLIVIGTREPSQVERMLGHSRVASSVQRMARCDVLIVH